MEHAEVQSEWIAAMLNRTGVFSEVRTHRDLNGKDRATSAVLTPSDPDKVRTETVRLTPPDLRPSKKSCHK
jgi:release factor glutamine methyltransferase